MRSSARLSLTIQNLCGFSLLTSWLATNSTPYSITQAEISNGMNFQTQKEVESSKFLVNTLVKAFFKVNLLLLRRCIQLTIKGYTLTGRTGIFPSYESVRITRYFVSHSPVLKWILIYLLRFLKRRKLIYLFPKPSNCGKADVLI